MFNWLSFNTNVLRYEDSFARSFRGKLQGIELAIDKAIDESAHQVVLVAHFVDTFTQLQDMLEGKQAAYQVSPEKLDRKWFDTIDKSGCGLTLTLGEMLDPIIHSKREATDKDKRISVIVAEKHPLIANDDKVREFCESLPCRVKWGYFLSFEDAAVDQLIDKRAIKILDMFGMGENELVTSKMLSNMLKQSLKKIQPNYHSMLPADSAHQWLKQNLKPINE